MVSSKHAEHISSTPCHDLALYDSIEIYWTGYGSLSRAAVGALFLCHLSDKVCFMLYQRWMHMIQQVYSMHLGMVLLFVSFIYLSSFYLACSDMMWWSCGVMILHRLFIIDGWMIQIVSLLHMLTCVAHFIQSPQVIIIGRNVGLIIHLCCPWST